MSLRACRPRVPRGFTLMEVIVTIALLLALVGAMSYFSFNVLAAREATLAASRQHLAAATLIERLERDLRVCVAGNDAYGAGVRGDETSLTLLVRSVPASWAERGLEDPVPFADLERAEYRFDPERMLLEGRRSVVQAAADVPGSFALIGDALPHVRFRYHDGTDWRPSFDSSAARRLPQAIEIAVWFDPWPGDEPLDPDAVGAEPALDEWLAEDDLDAFDDEPVVDERGALDAFGLDEAPMPDRVRIILIPDSQPPAEDEAEVTP